MPQLMVLSIIWDFDLIYKIKTEMKKIILILAIIFYTTTVVGQNKNEKVAFEVAGICEMCKERIEKAALTTKGVKYANWDLETHMLSLIIDERKTTVQKIQENVAAVGHSTVEVETTLEAYNNLDECCKYNDEDVINDHK